MKDQEFGKRRQDLGFRLLCHPVPPLLPQGVVASPPAAHGEGGVCSRTVLVVATALVAACAGSERQQAVNATLRTALASSSRPPYVTADAEGKKLWKLTQQFYERRQHTPAWIDGTDPLPQIGQLVTALKNAASEGLDPHL